MKKTLYLLTFLLLLAPILTQAQRPDEKPKKWQFKGYIKSLQSIIIPDIDTTILTDNLLHNRLNFKWFPNDNFTFTAEARNRVFYGELVSAVPFYSDIIDADTSSLLDLSWVVFDKPSIVMHTMIDRLYFEYRKGDWEVRLGKQRINWGINLAFNPNDLFNTFSFIDFDYEERPGSDALRVQYFLDYASSFEIAIKAVKHTNEIVAAGMYRFNKWEYDFQVLGGVFEEDIAIGAGWAGNIKNVGFKGEMTYFHPFASTDTRAKVFAAALSADISVKDWFITGAFLYTSNGATGDLFSNVPSGGGLATLFALSTTGITNPTPKSLYPYRYSLIANVAYTISPLVSGSLATFYNPGSDHALFLNPSLTISLSQDWDLAILSQLFFAKTDPDYQIVSNTIYGRLKWSF